MAVVASAVILKSSRTDTGIHVVLDLTIDGKTEQLALTCLNEENLKGILRGIVSRNDIVKEAPDIPLGDFDFSVLIPPPPTPTDRQIFFANYGRLLQLNDAVVAGMPVDDKTRTDLMALTVSQFLMEYFA